MALQALATVTTLMGPPDFLQTLNQRDCACNIDPPAASYVIMRRAGLYRGENSGPGSRRAWHWSPALENKISRNRAPQGRAPWLVSRVAHVHAQICCSARENGRHSEKEPHGRCRGEGCAQEQRQIAAPGRLPGRHDRAHWPRSGRPEAPLLEAIRPGCRHGDGKDYLLLKRAALSRPPSMMQLVSL